MNAPRFADTRGLFLAVILGPIAYLGVTRKDATEPEGTALHAP
ncbi:hypothetical protein [Streptomyces sp. BK340]|nr:hypothetical protein [Streptomyces sp. BK340]